VSFLQKAKDKASEVAREAADATSKAAGAVAAKAQDPETQDKMKSGLSAAGRTTGAVAKEAADVSAKAATAAVARAQDPATQAKVKGGLATAGRGARTMVERIDPGILADMIIKATALQEKANARLRRKGSIYRIGEIQVTASLPPGISFAIVRLGDEELAADAGVNLHSSTELLAEEAETDGAPGADAVPEIISLDVEEQAAIAFEIAEAEASMDAAVGALGGVDVPAPEPGPQDGTPA
jgi:hypothetical protein